MQLALRMINKNRWVMADDGWQSAQSDLLADMRTARNTLSFYEIDGALLSLGRVLAALGANRDRITKLDYILFDVDIISAQNLRRQETVGLTADQEVNACHFDVTDLTVLDLVGLAKEVFLRGERFRVHGKELKNLLEESLRSGFVDKSQIRLKDYHQGGLGTR